MSRTSDDVMDKYSAELSDRDAHVRRLIGSRLSAVKSFPHGTSLTFDCGKQLFIAADELDACAISEMTKLHKKFKNTG